MQKSPNHPIWHHPVFQTDVFAYYRHLYYGGAHQPIKKLGLFHHSNLPTLTELQSLRNVWCLYDVGYGGYEPLKLLHKRDLLYFKRGYAKRKAWERLMRLVKYIMDEAQTANIDCFRMAETIDRNVQYNSLNQLVKSLKERKVDL